MIIGAPFLFRAIVTVCETEDADDGNRVDADTRDRIYTVEWGEGLGVERL